MRNLEFCDRCLPEKSIPAMGFIPLPEMTNIGDTRDNERKILLCRTHYLEDKEKCFYVIPFNRDDDPVDNFLTRVKRKHNRIRGKARKKAPVLKEMEEPLDPIILEDFPKPRKSRNTNREGTPKYIGFRKDFDPTAEKPKLLVPKNGSGKKPARKVHFLENDKITCGLPVASTIFTTEIDPITCKFCIGILNQRALDQEPIQV